MIMIQSIFFRSVVSAYLYMPGMVFFTKMVPHQIEATMLGIAMSIIKFNSEVIGRVWVYLLDLHFGVTIDDYQNLWKMFTIQAVLLVIPFFFYKLIIKRKQVELVQVVVHYADRVTRSNLSNLRQTVKLDLNKALNTLRQTSIERRTAVNDLNTLVKIERQSRRNPTIY